jgi:elongation factor P--(R)-beta-lysine ligase
METVEQIPRHNTHIDVNRQPFDTARQSTAAASPWWTPQSHADRRPFLQARARVAIACRSWFAERDFIEVEPACLQVSPGGERHLAAFATELVGPSGAQRRLYLHASPEFACKKLLAAGERRIFSLGRVFRNRDAGPLHLPEFTMLEWYRVEEPLARVEEDCLLLLRAAAQAAGARAFAWRGVAADPFAEPERLTVAQAFQRHADVDLVASMTGDGEGLTKGLASEARRIGVRVAADDSWSDLFSKILSAKVEPRLGLGRPTILGAYPASEAALARRMPEDPRFAERFELYCCGVELANAFGELTDPIEQRRRLVVEAQARERIYGESLPLDEDFLSALALMPDASGCALGFDRLVVLAAGAERIEQVAWTPIPPADGA